MAAAGMAAKTHVVGGKKLSIALKAIEQKITNNGVLRVGFLESEEYPAGANDDVLPVAQVAFWNEFGTRTAPARPAFRAMIAQESKDWGAKIGKAIIAMNYDGEKALRLLGQDIRDDLENEIATWDTPPNAPATIAKKGFDAPLKDTGQMQRAPDFEITKP